MKIGTIMLDNKIYDLDYMKKLELEELLEKNNSQKNTKFNDVKLVCKREKEENIPIYFKNFIDSIAIFSKSEAIIKRAIIQKTSDDCITDKLNKKRMALNISIVKINPKYDPYNSKYLEIQNNIESIMKKYENVLRELAIFFDTKIEQLILKKLELEAELIGSIVKDEYFYEEECHKKEEKENDKLLISLSNSVKSFISKLTNKKEQKEIDVTMISKLQDKEELKKEQSDKLNLSLENTIEVKKENLEYIKVLEDEIVSVEKEINRLNSNKENSIMDAMENNCKQLIIQNNNMNFFGKIKLFFKSKLNPNKVIFENIINPMNQYIKEYEGNILENINR